MLKVHQILSRGDVKGVGADGKTLMAYPISALGLLRLVTREAAPLGTRHDLLRALESCGVRFSIDLFTAALVVSS